MATLLLISFALFSSTTAGELPVQLDAVVQALSQGDAKAVGANFDETVELVLPGVEDIYQKDQAIKLLASFFKKHPAKNFSRVHGGTSNGSDGSYVIGSLTCNDGIFRVYIYGRGSASSVVQELRIEPE